MAARRGPAERGGEVSMEPTPAMIAAGTSEMLAFDSRFESEADCVLSIFNAMMAVVEPSNVVQFSGITTIDESPQTTLEKAKCWGMEKCMVIGLDANNQLCFGGSWSEAGEMLLTLEAAKQQIIQTVIPSEVGR